MCLLQSYLQKEVAGQIWPSKHSLPRNALKFISNFQHTDFYLGGTQQYAIVIQPLCCHIYDVIY